MIRFDNNETLNNLSARLRDREIGAAEIVKPAVWGDLMPNPYTGKSAFKWKTLNLSIEFRGADQLSIEINKSKAITLFDGRFIRFTDMLGWRFYCVLNGEPSISDTIHRRYQTVNYSLLCIAETYEPIKGTHETNPGIIRAVNVYAETPAILEVSGADAITVNLGSDQFVITNIGSGTVTIGDGKVLKNGVNHWSNVEMTRWPRVTAETPISFTPAGAAVKVTYRGRMI